MSEKLFIGIDVGTYETKGVLVNLSGDIMPGVRYGNIMK